MSEIERNKIKEKIQKLKADKAAATGTPCEVFSRVVGYLRPVQNYNDGKKQEYAMRKTYERSCVCGN